MKYKILTLALIFSFPFLLTACTLADLPLIGKYIGNSPIAKPNVTLTYWGLWEDPEVMQKLILKYQEMNPHVTINYEDRSLMDPLEYKERVFRRSTESTGPDIARVHVSWMSKLTPVLTPAPTNVMSLEEASGKFYDVALKNISSDGKIYGVPTYYDGLVLVYNKDHFDEIGQLSAPTAWAEFRNLALKLRVVGEDDTLVRAGAALGTSDNIEFATDILGLMFAQAGVTLPDGLEQKAAWDALGFYTNFAKEDKVWDRTMPKDVIAFSQEKVSMIIVHSWSILDIVKNRPDLKIGIAPVPQARESKPANWSSFWVEVVPSTAPNAEESWKFLKFLSEEETQKTLFTEQSNVRAFGTPYSLKTLKSELSSNPYLGPVVSGAESGNTYEISSRSGNNRQEQSLRSAINAVLAGTSTKDALSAVKTELQK